MIAENQLRWCGHNVPMTDERMTEQLVNVEIAEGKRHQCKPKKIKDDIRTGMKSHGMVQKDIETLISGCAK